jgi:cytidine deaminase
MSEFCKGDFKIIVAKSLEDYKVYSFSEILPFTFELEK